MDIEKTKEAMQEFNNLGVADEYYDEARELWIKYFPELSVVDLLEESQNSDKTLEDVIIQKVMEVENIEDPEYAAKMLLAVVVYTMGFG